MKFTPSFIKNNLQQQQQAKQEVEIKFQNEQKKKLIEWQIANQVVIQPVLQPTMDRIQASLIFIKATIEQINELKTILNSDNKGY